MANRHDLPAPLYKVYIDDLGEAHITTPGNAHTWDGKAFFLGYITLDVKEASGDAISIAEHRRRLRLVPSMLRPRGS